MIEERLHLLLMAEAHLQIASQNGQAAYHILVNLGETEAATKLQEAGATIRATRRRVLGLERLETKEQTLLARIKHLERSLVHISDTTDDSDLAQFAFRASGDPPDAFPPPGP